MYFIWVDMWTVGERGIKRALYCFSGGMSLPSYTQSALENEIRNQQKNMAILGYDAMTWWTVTWGISVFMNTLH